eukprot:TRINITY_DN2169_c0_g1_i1.p1 TRINITY_DN2169_c0_g1~~TRINITY_DN2169_c0_g1_i1.p1  ORF type:complete len:535 (+),score=130.48 TRINITY_DN2169_c0_g1_i1:59-1663(+)
MSSAAAAKRGTKAFSKLPSLAKVTVETASSADLDEEQQRKYEETIDILLAAGYFRARISTLSPFDKVIGGMAWCISSSSVDLDIDVVFQENSTIGQKIKIGESIVNGVRKMKCPHPLQSHQIQGQDYINIFPVVQWLVKRAIEAREAMGDFARLFSESQFDKSYELPDEKLVEANRQSATVFLSGVSDRYKPKRRYRQSNAELAEAKTSDQRAQATLLEFGRLSKAGSETAQADEKKRKSVALTKAATGASEEEDEAAKEEARIREIMGKLAEVEGDIGRISSAVIGNIVGMQSEEIRLASAEYANLSKGLGLGEAQAQKAQAEETHRRMIAANERQLAGQEKKLAEIRAGHDELAGQLEAKNAELQKKIAYNDRILREIERLNSMENESNTQDLQNLKSLVALNEALKAQEAEFKANCKRQLGELQTMLQALEDEGPTEEAEKEKSVDETLASENERLQKARQIVNAKNRDFVNLQRKIDEVPTRTELIQYERRFMELYEQINAKLLETRKYFNTYNNLEDVKNMLSKGESWA